MRRVSVLFLVVAFALSAFSLFAADLTIEYQMNTTGPDLANNFLSFKGAVGTVVKDQYDPTKVEGTGADAITGASKLMSTEIFNAYRTDVQGKKTMPSGLRGLFLYPIAGEPTRLSDGLTVAKAADGSIMVRTIHRGTAYEFVTDKAGKLKLPTNNVKMRVIGTTDNKMIGADFGTSVTDINWTKIWDKNIADGQVVGTSKVKTGKIGVDNANSELWYWAGDVQFAFDGKILKVFAALDVKKK